MPTRILHVVESLGGGVLSSVLSMVEATPDFEHHLAVWPRRQHADTGDERHAFAAVATLPSNPVRAVRALRRLVATLEPDHVHAHSSYAGLLVRVVDLGADVVYSPHCFAFERRDIGPLTQAGVRRVEQALVGSTSMLVACSPREALLAERLGHRDVVTVPNRSLEPPELVARFQTPLRVVTVGRIGPQKDWRFLIAVKGYLDEVLGRRLEWEWLGGGDPDAEAALREHGVSVAGWLPRGEVVRRLGTAQVYLHTAAWEAAPVSILESAAAGLPMAVRGIDTLVSLGVPGTESTAADLAARIVDLHDSARWAEAQQQSLRFAAAHSAARQRERLHAAYRLVPAELVHS
ncbi:glycosyltransferase family 4 protein [Nocardioides stalactiti]|uniref:glycosyltransferase family 4 protein n=1 Tax=Nocardioides stalactiti TaxID=2755356 RepID=UPI001601A4D0|nr:glycosyltransferase family 4 protein [Nocardioides stalactiti]